MRIGKTTGLVLPISAFIATLCAGVPAAGQAAPGDRVRVTVGSTRVVGRLDQSIGDSVVLVTESGVRHAYARATPRRFEVSMGQRSRKLKGAAIGLGAGAAAGFLIGMAAESGDDDGDCLRGASGECIFADLEVGKGLEMVVGAVIGGAAGAAIGAVVGSRRVEKWRQVRAQPRVAVWPRGRGAVVAVRWDGVLGGAGARH